MFIIMLIMIIIMSVTMIMITSVPSLSRALKWMFPRWRTEASTLMIKR